MDSLETFGFATVCLSLVCYAFEDRSRHFTLGFAITCLAGAVYAFQKEAWPFAFIEIFWTVLAVRKWARTREVVNDGLSASTFATALEAAPAPATSRASKAG